jgi:hypothetical protein
MEAIRQQVRQELLRSYRTYPPIELNRLISQVKLGLEKAKKTKRRIKSIGLEGSWNSIELEDQLWALNQALSEK